MTVTAVNGANGSQATTNAASDAASNSTTNANNTNQAQQFAQAMQNAKGAQNASAPGTGSPESAQNGAAAAQDLLNPNNPYFNNPQLTKYDPSYNPETAKAQAFAATLYNYEQKGDSADIAQFLNTLGPDQAAKFFAEAGNLQGSQVTDNGVVFAQNQGSLDQVLGKALVSPGVNLGDATQSGTLANSLVQQATQSGSSALSIAGILNQAGTSPQAEALKNQFLGQIVVDGKALGNPTTDSAFYDRASYAQAALTVINGDPALLSAYQNEGVMDQQHGVVPTYQQLQQNAGFNPLNPSGSYQAGFTAGQHIGLNIYGQPSSFAFMGDINNHLNDAQWLAGYFQGLGPQATTSLIDRALNSFDGGQPGWDKTIAQALGAAAPFLPPSFEQALGQSAGTQGITASLRLDDVLHNLDPSQNYDLLTNVGKGYLSAAATQQGDQKSISNAMAADAFSLAALDNPAGRQEVMNYLAGQQQANPNFLHDFGYQAVQGMALLAGPNELSSPVAIQGISPLMIALNEQSAGSAGNQMALQMFYGATDYLFGSSSNPNVSQQVKGTLPLIQEEGLLGSHTVFVNGQAVQENLGLRTALMDVFYNNAPQILHQWEGNNQIGGLGTNGQIQLERFTAFELSSQGDPSVAQNNLDAMFNVAERFAFYSLGKTNDPAITSLVGANGSGRWAANMAGWILGSIANEGNLAAQDLNQSAQARAQAQQFQERVAFDWLGLGLDLVGLGSIGGVLGGMLGNASPIVSKLALWTNNFKTGIGSLTSLPRDWTFIQSDTALGQGPAIDTLPQQDQDQIRTALRQAGVQNVGVDQVMTMLEGVYSHYNLPDYKDEIDTQFGVAGGTDLSFAMAPYMNALYSGGAAGNMVSLSQWVENPVA
jgi:hypothetical protein